MYSSEKIEFNDRIDRVVYVVAKAWHSEVASWLELYSLKKDYSFAQPGNSRQGSIRNALEVVASDPPKDDIVLIHDGVRPMVSDELIDACLDGINDADAVLPVLPLKDTVYSSNDGREVSNLLNRDSLFAGQAPESFKFSMYYEINRSATEQEIDQTRGSSEIAFRHGMKVGLIEGSEANFKITTRSDLERFEELLAERR